MLSRRSARTPVRAITDILRLLATRGAAAAIATLSTASSAGADMHQGESAIPGIAYRVTIFGLLVAWGVTALLWRLDRRQTICHDFKHVNRIGSLNKGGDVLDASSETARKEGDVTPEEGRVEPQATPEAIAARVRWLIQETVGAERGSIQRFADRTGIQYGRLRNILSKTNYLGMAEALKIKEFSKVDLDFIYAGEIDALPFSVADKLRRSVRLRELYEAEGAQLPDWHDFS